MSVVSKAVRETYAAHCILMSQGFKPDDIFVSVNYIVNASPVGHYSVVTLKRAGKEFSMHLEPVKDAVAFTENWLKFINDKRSWTKLELDILVQSSDIWDQREKMLHALVIKGLLSRPEKTSYDVN